ncbi:CRISPR-associated endoribonuclease Cas6 [Paenibacillus alginolyticus]|uniref:CRISPR-associated endoribonuclease n=1 Tax=Paenibacillus alginolyticus TaxID=59839 RepID=A0ABT4G7E5_9BACL|nr:CRISPR-associated endoribonuclease Cas6 [Paenibacillus alginolyticus]MCY9692096.1 CRISPR-associated endoribonuclease Cas6 [Paenibacillus alginolyticus]MEC0147861.1 CRISPR-associated endoribonuclease Cas6 [Paenibacillus alginolyticus]
MRAILSFSSPKPIRLSMHYQSTLMGLIYQHISDTEFQKFMHDEGYSHQGRIYKNFSFSRIHGKFQLNPQRKEIIFESPFSFVVCSSIDQFLHDLIRTIIQSDSLLLGSQEIRFESVHIMPAIQISSKIRIRMLSPLVNYSTLTHPNGLKHTHYYKPTEALFSSMVEENLKRKYFSRHEMDEIIHKSPFSIKMAKVIDKDKVITYFRDTVIEGWMGSYEMEGHPALLQWAYNTALGSKNSMGFGCFEIQQMKEVDK